MSKLEEIKKRLEAATPLWEHIYETHAQQYAGMYRIISETDLRPKLNPVSLCVLLHNAPTDIAWLIEELEKARYSAECGNALGDQKIQSLEAEVERLERKYKILMDDWDIGKAKLQRQDEMLKVAEDGLKFYGDEENWRYAIERSVITETDWSYQQRERDEDPGFVGGKTARETLTKLQELRERDE